MCLDYPVLIAINLSISDRHDRDIMACCLAELHIWSLKSSVAIRGEDRERSEDKSLPLITFNNRKCAHWMDPKKCEIFQNTREWKMWLSLEKYS